MGSLRANGFKPRWGRASGSRRFANTCCRDIAGFSTALSSTNGRNADVITLAKMTDHAKPLSFQPPATANACGTPSSTKGASRGNVNPTHRYREPPLATPRRCDRAGIVRRRPSRDECRRNYMTANHQVAGSNPAGPATGARSSADRAGRPAPCERRWRDVSSTLSSRPFISSRKHIVSRRNKTDRDQPRRMPMELQPFTLRDAGSTPARPQGR